MLSTSRTLELLREVDALKEEVPRELRGATKISGNGCQPSGNAPNSRASSPQSTEMMVVRLKPRS